MAYRPQSSFSTGELTPELQERTDLEKYRDGLSVGRNILISKMGSIISRSGTSYFLLNKNQAAASVIFSPPYSQYVIELSAGNLRFHDTVAGTFQDAFIPLTQAQVIAAQFVPAGIGFLYIFIAGFAVAKLSYGNVAGFSFGFLQPESAIFLQYSAPLLNDAILPTSIATGQPVDYAISYMANGQESDYLEIPSSGVGYGPLLEPLNAGEFNTISIALNFVNVPVAEITSLIFYRRPSGGGAYGFCGELQTINPASADYTITDYNGVSVPDFTHSPPISIPIPTPPALTANYLAHQNPIVNITSRTGAVYQQRLLTSDDNNTEAIYGSRTGLQNDFFAETTLTADSAILFKSGSTGSANVLRLFDSQYGLLVFTTIGVYQNTGALDYTNLALEKVSNIVIQDNVPPLPVSGGLLIVDKATNSVQSFIYSYVEQTFPPDELSIFSYHLLANKQVVSWAFQDGEIPLVWIVLNDGSLLTVTYQREQQMRAWTHHDSSGAIFESVTVLRNLQSQAIVYFSVNRNGVRSLETLSPRILQDVKNFIAMDATTTFTSLLGAANNYTGAFVVYPEDITNWGGLLTVTAASNAFANVTGQGKVGDIYRFFDSGGSAVDLQVVQFVSPTVLIVQPMYGLEFPADQGAATILYNTFSTLTGLSYLNGQQVSLMVDGYVMASPNNDIEKYDTYIVENGQLTLNNGKLGAIIHVGLPFTADVETLELDTVEQKPTLLETKLVNKVWMKVLNTRGLYVSCDKLPENDSVFGMTDPETMYNRPVVGTTMNRAQLPVTRRYQIISKNNYKSNGKVCVRQVDPLPFEILSIIPDLQVLI